MRKIIYLFLSFLFLFNLLHAQDVIPSAPAGGKSQLKYFIEQELIYPVVSLQQKVEGKSRIRYFVDTKGYISHKIFTNSISPEIDEETLRIFNMIEWDPATKIGIPVEDSGIFEVEYNIKKYDRLCKRRGYLYPLIPYEPMDTSGIIYYYRNLDAAPHPIFTNKSINIAGYIAANLKYPDAALKQNLSGTVKLGFIVEPHGKISNLRILTALGAGCSEEAIRIVRLIKWMPGIKNDLAVRTRMSISINFSLESGPNGIFNPNIKSSYGGY